MYLKRLEMQGFKSFADKTVLEFMPGITSVIGPNGSGKSNISDCIRWILGEQSMKSLRGQKSQDIIFAGTQNRKSIGFSEASLVFDNSDKSLPIEFEEVVITRKIYRSGENSYYINKVQCRLKDILELIMDTGIGKDGYSIIGQGKIDEIISNKSEDRRHIFEEAAGIVKYRTRKEETEKKLEHTKLNLLRITDILAEIESNLEPLHIQSDKAKKYLNLKEELKNIEIGLFLHNIEKYKGELEEVIKNEEIYKTNCNTEETKLEKILILKEELKSEIEEITDKIEKTSSISFESQKEIEILGANVSVAETRIENNKENKKRYENEINEIEIKKQERLNEINSKKDKKDDLKNSKEKYLLELNRKEEELAEITKKLSDKEITIEGFKKKIDQNIDLKYEILSEINILENNKENMNKRNKQIADEQEFNIHELDVSQMAKEDIAKEFYEIDNKKNNVVKALEKINNNKEEADKNIKELENKIHLHQNECRIKEAKLKFLIETEKEKEGYTKSVKELLKQSESVKELGQGMHGVLANVIDVPEKYQTAIEMTLGMTLQNIVTDTKEDAKKLVEYLRKNNLGRASFLPIESINGEKLNNLKIKNSGFIGIASDLISFDKKYEKIVLSFLGKTVIVDNMDTAIAISKEYKNQFRIVTLEGDIINNTGGITGGSVVRKSVNILSRGKEIEKLEKEIEVLKKKVEDLEKQKQEYIQSIEDVFESIELFTNQLQEIQITYATRKQKLEYISENIQKFKDKKEKLKQEKESLVNSKKTIDENIKNCNIKLEKIDKESNELNQKVEEFVSKNEGNQKYIDEINLDITNLKISVSSFDETESSMQEIEDILNKEINGLEISIKQKIEEIKKIEKQNIKLMESIEDTKHQIHLIRQNVNDSTQNVEKLKTLRIEQSEKLSMREKEQTDKFKIIEDMKSQIVKVEVRKTKLEEDISGVTNKMWEEYELTFNNIDEYKKPINIQTTTREVVNIRTQIKELGSISVDSIEEYKELKNRFENMSVQKDDLEETLVKLKKIIVEMTIIMKDEFKEKFKEINTNFNVVFSELFGGGYANLELTDEDNILECGIEINVQPPGKKLQSMTLLSGGEKAFTAIALLFAILKINPAPFCVLDEIEAALDDVNVFKYAEYLKKFAGDTQFLIITHRKGTMEAASTVYGVTMEESGISKLLSMKIENK